MTSYCITFKFHNTGTLYPMRFDSATERALAIISYGQYADVVRQWEEA
jgi:hypothetical protein